MSPWNCNAIYRFQLQNFRIPFSRCMFDSPCTPKPAQMYCSINYYKCYSEGGYSFNQCFCWAMYSGGTPLWPPQYGWSTGRRKRWAVIWWPVSKRRGRSAATSRVRISNKTIQNGMCNGLAIIFGCTYMVCNPQKLGRTLPLLLRFLTN